MSNLVSTLLGLRLRGRTTAFWLGMLAGRLRGLVPIWLLPTLVRLRARIAWRDEKVREDARREMRLVLAYSRPDVDIDAAARRYVERQVLRGELRWHESFLSTERVEGWEHLRAAQERGRGVVLNWMHHGQDNGVALQHGEHGFAVTALVATRLFGDSVSGPNPLADLPPWLWQNLDLHQRDGNTLMRADAGLDAMLEVLAERRILAIAIDVPGRTPVKIFARELVGSFGAARLAAQAGAPVVIQTAELEHPDDLLPVARFHPPLYPEDFSDAGALHRAMLDLHEPYIVRWPELYDIPTSNWGLPEGVDL